MRIAAGLLLLTVVARAGDGPHEQVLRSGGIAPDAAGVRAYLRSLVPDDAVLALARRQVEALASPIAARRRHAAEALRGMGVTPIPVLAEAVDSDDPEVARHARRLLAQARELRAAATEAAFRLIAVRRLKGFAADIMAVLPVLEERHARLVAEQALVATVTPADAVPLLRLVDAGSPRQQPVALAGYAVAAGRAAQAELRVRLADGREPVRLAAAWALADLGDRECLPVFAQLLDANDLHVRLGAVYALRAVSGQRFGYVAAGDAARRTEAVLGWGDWVGQHGARATWSLPVPRARLHLGRILVTQYNGHRVVEFDLMGRQVWEKRDVKAGWACCGTPEGHRLVAQITERRVVEFDVRGEEVRRFTALPGFPNSVQRLPNGNTLIAISFGVDILIELDPDGRRVWEKKIDGYPTDAERLPNGNTLVSLYRAKKVVEIDPGGRVVWEVADLDGPYAAQRLDDGNTLVCEIAARRVVELTPAGRVAWQYRAPHGCMAARRLPDGRTLVSGGGGVCVVDRSGRETWILRAKGAVRANCY